MYGRNQSVNKISEYNLYDPINKVYDIKEIIKLYDLYYNYNLRTCTKFFETKWVDPRDIIQTDVQWKWDSLEEKEELIKETLEIGYHHPMFAFKHDKGYNIYVGNHRMAVIHELIKEGFWPQDKKVLLFVIPSFLRATKIKLSNGHPDVMIKLPENAYLFFMSYLKEKRFSNIKFLSETEFDKGISVVLMDSVMMYYKILNNISNALGPVTQQYKKDFGYYIPEVLEMSKFLNNYDAWKKWIEEDPKYTIEKGDDKIVISYKTQQRTFI